MSTATLKTEKVTPEVVTVTLPELKVGDEFRSAGSQKRWIVAEVNTGAKVPYVHIFNEKVNYKMKGKCLEEKIYVFVQNNGQDYWTASINTAIEVYKAKNKPVTQENKIEPTVTTSKIKKVVKPAKKGSFEKVMEIHKKATKSKAKKDAEI